MAESTKIDNGMGVPVDTHTPLLAIYLTIK